jgi:DNA-binding NtrC family response regulator
VRFVLPPLRERKEDIVPLALHFLKAFNKKFRRSARGFSASAFRRLLGYGWPGNVRELENAVQKAVLFCQDRLIGEGMLDLSVAHTALDAAVPVGDSRALKEEHLLHLLEKHNWIVKRAAAEARVSLPTFFRKMRRFEIRRKGKRK